MHATYYRQGGASLINENAIYESTLEKVTRVDRNKTNIHTNLAILWNANEIAAHFLFIMRLCVCPSRC